MSRHTPRRLPGLVRVAVVTMVLGAAACGDDDDAGDTAATGAPGGTSTATAAATPPGTAADAAADTVPATATAAATAPRTPATAPATTDAASTVPETSAAPETTVLDPAATSGSGWRVNTDDCVDPDAANAPIEGTVRLGSALPLSGGPAATAYAPFADGMRAYVDFANQNDLVPGHDIALEIGDDQFNPALTPIVVNQLLDQGVHAFTGIIGSAPNFAVRELLNEECVPQMMGQSGAPDFGDVANFPWSFGGLIPYDIESAAYASEIERMFPDGATAAVFYVNIEFGQILSDGFIDAAADHNIRIVENQTIEAGESAPPAAQVRAIANAAPDAIMAVPLGAQCPAFLTELANAKAAEPGWDPVVFITNTCASDQIVGSADPAANVFYSSASSGLRDVGAPDVADLPEVVRYLEFMRSQGYPETSISVGTSGWNAMEVTVEIIRRAAESPDGLTRASIINAARDLHYHPSLTRPGVEYKMSGEEDGFYPEDVQLVRFDGSTGEFELVGDLITAYRHS